MSQLRKPVDRSLAELAMAEPCASNGGQVGAVQGVAFRKARGMAFLDAIFPRPPRGWRHRQGHAVIVFAVGNNWLLFLYQTMRNLSLPVSSSNDTADGLSSASGNDTTATLRHFPNIENVVVDAEGDYALLTVVAETFVNSRWIYQ